MSLILRVLFMVLTTTGFYLVASHVLFLPNKTTQNVIRHPHGKPTTEEQFAKALRPLTALLGRLFPKWLARISNSTEPVPKGPYLPLANMLLSEYKRTRYESDFARLGMTVSPQEYTSGKIARSLMLALLGLAFIPLGIPLAEHPHLHRGHPGLFPVRPEAASGDRKAEPGHQRGAAAHGGHDGVYPERQSRPDRLL